MKTKDFIKMLQKEDPEGEGYIRLPGGGAPWFAERKEGYWDGPYQYIENPEDRKKILVESTRGYKIDIRVLKIDDIIWSERGDMDIIRKRIKVETTYLKQEHHLKPFWEYIEKEAAEAKADDDKFLIEYYNKVVDKFYNNGWEIRQPLDTKIGQYHCMKAYKWFHVPNQLNQGECDILIRSGKFYPEKKEKYYIWRHDPEKGQNWKIKRE
jgi:hypothetical protein